MPFMPLYLFYSIRHVSLSRILALASLVAHALQSPLVSNSLTFSALLCRPMRRMVRVRM